MLLNVGQAIESFDMIDAISDEMREVVKGEPSRSAVEAAAGEAGGTVS